MTEIEMEQLRDKWLQAYERLSLLAKTEGSFADVVLSAAAYMIQDGIEKVQAARYACHPSTAEGEDQDSHGADYGIIRKEGTTASGIAVFSGTGGVEIPAGTGIVCDGLIYYTDTAGLIGDEIPFTASEAGNAYNKPGNSTFVLLSGIGGVTGLTVEAHVLGGSNAEENDAYRGRLLDRMQHPQMTGTIGWYESLAESFPGVGKAVCLPAWDGPGTVKMVCIDPDGNPITDELVRQIEDGIAAKEYVGSEITVSPADSLPVTVSVQITGDYDASALKKSLQDYLTSKAIPKSGYTAVISYAKIGYLILETEGVEDYIGLTVNGGSESIVVSSTQTPVLTLEVDDGT